MREREREREREGDRSESGPPFRAPAKPHSTQVVSTRGLAEVLKSNIKDAQLATSMASRAEHQKKQILTKRHGHQNANAKQLQ